MVLTQRQLDSRPKILSAILKEYLSSSQAYSNFPIRATGLKKNSFTVFCVRFRVELNQAKEIDGSSGYRESKETDIKKRYQKGLPRHASQDNQSVLPPLLFFSSCAEPSVARTSGPGTVLVLVRTVFYCTTVLLPS